MAFLQQAAALHRGGRLAEAEAAYRHLLSARPDQPQALHLLGVLLHQTGRSADGEALLRRAIMVDWNAGDPHNNLGTLLRETGRSGEALECFRAALRAEPNRPEIHHHLGLALLDQGDRAGAETAFRNAIRLQRDFVPARIDLGTLLIGEGRAADALACLRVALRSAAENPRVHLALGLALTAQGEHAAALSHYGAAITHAPGFFLEAHANHAAALVTLDRLDEAETEFRLILSVVPDDRTSLTILGQVLVKLDRAEESEPLIRALLLQLPDDEELHFALGALLNRADRSLEASQSFEAALRLKPDYAVAIHAQGIIAYDSGRLDESQALVEKAAALDSEDAEIMSSLSYAALLRRDYALGWPLFERRTRKPGNPRLAEPMWDGTPTDRTVIVHGEQGVGDNLQFCRFLPEAARRARIVVAGPASCHRLLEKIQGVASVHTEKPLPAYDLHCPMMSLVHVLGIPEAEFAAPVPYLQADQADIAMWRARLASLPHPRVGLVWAGNPKYHADRRRSLPLAALAPLREISHISFVSLQKGEPAAEITSLGWHDIADYTDDIEDFADTAALIEALDLVIAVDTAVAHLAGALGRPVWLLNRVDTDWRWQMEREDSPWYPSMRIFRQRVAGEWAEVVQRMAEALEESKGKQPFF